jgi:hypothetical protein
MRSNPGGTATVTAQDRWYAEIRAGRAFARGARVAPGGAGNFSEGQLFNPAASGVNAIIFTASASAASAVFHQLRQHNTALATLVGTGFNLLSGGAASQCVIRTATPAALDGTLIAELHMAANTPGRICPSWSFELGPGEGVLFAETNGNIEMPVVYFWIELPT